MMALGLAWGEAKRMTSSPKVCIAVLDGKGRLIDLLSQDQEISKVTDRNELETLLEPTEYLGNASVMVDRIFERKAD